MLFRQIGAVRKQPSLADEKTLSEGSWQLVTVSKVRDQFSMLRGCSTGCSVHSAVLFLRKLRDRALDARFVRHINGLNLHSQRGGSRLNSGELAKAGGFRVISKDSHPSQSRT